MSLLTRRLLILVALLVYMILMFVFFYPAFAANCCGEGAITDDSSQVDEPVNNYLLASKWDTTGIFAGEGFPAYRDSLLALQPNGDVLEIIGYYYRGEVQPADYESLGLARAAQIRQQHFAEIPEAQIKLSASPFPANPEVRTGYFPAGLLNWTEGQGSVVALDDRILIYFPYKSAQKTSDQVIDDYLAALAPQLIETGDKVQLTGHTDNIGGDGYNQALGQQRAESVKAILLRYGVPASQVSVRSKGKSEPAASNDTEAGRRQNRRVELIRTPA